MGRHDCHFRRDPWRWRRNSPFDPPFLESGKSRGLSTEKKAKSPAAEAVIPPKKEPVAAPREYKYSGFFFYKDLARVNISSDGSVNVETTNLGNLNFTGDMAALTSGMVSEGFLDGAWRVYAYSEPPAVGKLTSLAKTANLDINSSDLKKIRDWLESRKDPHRFAATLVCFDPGSAHRLPADAKELSYRLTFHGGGMDFVAFFERPGVGGRFVYTAIASTEGTEGTLKIYATPFMGGAKTLQSTHTLP